jgi:catechol 2,3-dioxygenase-like lactoylglutathione lyase family enzyme
MSSQLSLISLFLVIFNLSSLQAQEEKPLKSFTSGVIDIGIVVKDIEKSVKFYTETLALKEIKGFNVPAEKAAGIGLTDNQPAAIRVFVLDTDKDAKTKIKLMAFPQAPGQMQNQKFIHSSIGISYLTLFVTDMNKALVRLKKANVKLLGKTPSPIGGENFITVFHDPDGNFIELIGPMEQ